MARRPASEDKQARAAAEAAGHGGVVCLADGPWAGVGWWRDEWQRQQSFALYAGYVETGEKRENKPIKDPNGVDLRWYGPGVVFRFDPALVSPAKPFVAAEPPVPVYCSCGERLLMLQSDHKICERCRLGLTDAVVWRPFGVVPEEVTPWFSEQPAGDLTDSVEPADLPDRHVTAEPPASPSASVEQVPAAVAPDATEVADFVWSCLAHLYDR